ncbi:MAG TPA: ATP-binding cassette domain-containing protein [Rectinemataceae bacterium]|nr:ATP-binding cassette domain-containing protein [Rectinemataceae bacterium]
MHVELRDINKTFGKVHANASISLKIPPASIQGILGENGAGKSTLMKIFSGFYTPDSGEILLDGAPVVIHSPADAIRHGIGMLHQDPLDFPPMRLIDDFILGREGGLFPRRRAAARDFRELAARFGFSLDPDSYVDSLTVGERQQLEILRLLWLGARVLILDEPTTGISLPQKEKLFATLKKLAAEGMTILFVSHKLEDVEFLCDNAAVLRQGELVGTAQPPFDTRRLVEMMFGKEVPLAPKKPVVPGPRVLSVKGVSLEGVRLQMKGVDLRVHAGEVIGLAGMEGSGQSLFLGACAGLMQPVAGSFCLDEDEHDMTGRSHLDFKREGVAYLPAARLEQGLVPGLSLTEHFVLSEGMHGLFIDRKKAEELARERISQFNIKGTPESTVESLSGGNQQRALLALMRSPLSLILVEHPTRGLDIESTIYIWGKLKERCAQGTAIVFISSDLDEILQYSDRVLVFFAGRVSPPLRAESLSVEQLGGLIGGKGWESVREEAVDA